MTVLLDVNVLVALAWPNHIHHEHAARWFESQREQGWATCPVTQSGFVRVSSNRRIVPEAKSPAEAVAVLTQLIRLSDHHFWHDDIAFAGSEFIDPDRILGHHHVTDAHLVALAIRHKGRLATFDRNVAALVPASFTSSRVLLTLPSS